MNIARALVLMIAFGVLSVPVCAEPTEIIAVQIGTYKQFAAEAKQSVSRFGVVHVLTAKFMTVIQAFFGQVYLVVMIARLVGMHVSQNSSNS